MIRKVGGKRWIHQFQKHIFHNSYLTGVNTSKMKLNLPRKIALLSVLILLSFAIYMYFKVTATVRQNENLCFDTLAAQLESGVTPDQIFQEDYKELQLLVEYSLIARSQMLEISNRLRVDQDTPLSSSDLMVLKEGTEDYIEIREDLYKIAYAYECSIEVELSTLEKYGIAPERIDAFAWCRTHTLR